MKGRSPHHARMELEFARDPYGRSYVHRQYYDYPFHICRPFYLDDGPAKDMTTIYVQSCSGGLYTEDTLESRIAAGKGVQAHVTTQASTVVNQATRGPARQVAKLKVAEGALLEYTPDPVILFPGAHLHSTLTVELADTASVILFDSFLAHDYRNTNGVFDLLEAEIRVTRSNGSVTALDRLRFSGAEFRAALTGQMGAYPCHGSFFTIAPGADIAALVSASRSGVASEGDCFLGLSILPDESGISARILSKDAVSLKAALRGLWEQARKAITGSVPSPRRK